MIPTIAQACAMNALSYQGDGEVGDNSGWTRDETIVCRESGCVVVRWGHGDGSIYLAVRGSNSRRDTLDDLKVFLGQPPVARMAFFERYIEENCQEALENDTLMVGGHSLGGMVAMSAAARWQLRGLIQNSPGWLVDPPPPDRLARLVELRTGRDVVGVWGHSVPSTITLHDPNAVLWDLRKLHNVDRQMDLVQRQGLSNVRLDDPVLHAHPIEPYSHKSPGTLAWMKATWRRIHEDDLEVRQMAKSALPGRKSLGRR